MNFHKSSHLKYCGNIVYPGFRPAAPWHLQYLYLEVMKVPRHLHKEVMKVPAEMEFLGVMEDGIFKKKLYIIFPEMHTSVS